MAETHTVDALGEVLRVGNRVAYVHKSTKNSTELRSGHITSIKKRLRIDDTLTKSPYLVVKIFEDHGTIPRIGNQY